MIQNLTTNNFYVYGHYRKDTNTLFYVGKGCRDRAWSKRGRNKLWQRIVNKHGFETFIFYKNLPEDQAFQFEKDLILDLCPIANFSKGGIGGNTIVGKSMEEIEEINRKKSEKMSGKNHPQYGKPKSNKTKRKISKAWQNRSVQVVCNETGQLFRSISECAKILNIDKANLQRIRKGTRKSLKGLTFQFIEPARDPNAWSAQYDPKLNY